MKKAPYIILILVSIFASSVATAANVATATLTGFIQNGTITNGASSTANITSVIYSLGAPADGIATWDSGTGGGVASDFLTNPRYFQTVTWGGLNVAAGNAFSFSSLDIDLIQTFSPLSVTGGVLDTIGSSLVNATLTLLWSDQSSASVSLTQQAWSATQNLKFGSNVNAVPVPAALFMFAPALLGFFGLRRKIKA